ncbi:MAG: biotin carboxylase N-terminal domain-containing protein, partial [archaeon]|nr:biotin carboxylase N-terminal domain-containing protein [archaeon]
MANRGEIACRVFRTAKKMGVKTVAVYSEPDAGARHVAMADEAVFIGPAASAESYLRIDKILDACKRTGAQVVHPGYGFLSENSQFVAALDAAGIAFAGPPASAMLAMGDKINSKKIAKDAGVRVIPGYVGEIETEEEAVRLSREIGYPVMMKASAGGGGKGMRVAWNDEEAREGFRIAKTEAKSSFGDDRMLIEKFIHNPRHVEIQVLADGQGTCLYLNERECSIQRRNQKVLEEAPSPFIDPETRKRMGEQACALAKAVGYRSAGTVEMLIDANRQFYFLEMNTRLQVEHPITELITGQDIVEHMINIAAGHPLSITQADLTPRGWATEARVYAEDPLRGFLPSVGRLTAYREPPERITIPGGEEVVVRTDAGVVEGGEISVFYDPLIAKLITYGSDRQASIEGMKRALDQYVIRGFNNNVCFLRAMMDHPRYVAGELTTNFIPEEFPDGFHGIQLSPLQRNQLLAITSLIHMTLSEEARSVDNQLRLAALAPHPAAHTHYI